MPEKITNNADETSLGALLESPSIFEVPYFQRSYKWSSNKIRAFAEDLVQLADEGLEETHFIGAIIIQGGQAPPTVARSFQVIDGQQRLTTCCLFMLAYLKILIELNQIETARSLFNSYVVTSKDTRGKSNIKLHPSGNDREDLNSVVKEVLDYRNFKDTNDLTKVILLEEGGAKRSRQISKNFNLILKLLREQVASAQEGVGRLEHLYTALLQSITLVQIDIKDPLMGPVIFDRLNSGQEPMTVGELVKNDVLSRGTELTDAQRVELERTVWQPFISKFGAPELKRFDTYLFPYGLIVLSSNVRKGDVYKTLRTDWTRNELMTSEIVNELKSLQDEFLDLIDGLNRCGFEKEFNDAINNLVRVGLPTMMFSFVMKVLNETKLGRLDKIEAGECLRYVESFIVRRGAFGLEPSGLHAAFKGMWNECESEKVKDHATGAPYRPLSQLFASSIGKRATVKWPNAMEFEKSLRERSLYGSKITKYILSEYNRSLPGDPVQVEGVEVEHILPQSMSATWKKVFTQNDHGLWLNRFGNLTLLTERMNKDVSNGGYHRKKTVYVGSKYRITQKLASDYSQWSSQEISDRTEELLNWALERWPEE